MLRIEEMKKEIKSEKKIERAHADRLDQEKIVAQRTKELSLLNQEEHAYGLEAQQREQDFLAAQAIQDKKALEAKHAATKANLASLKRRDEIFKRNGESKMKLLKILQEREMEKLME